MTQTYQDYGYTTPEPGSGEAGRALAAEFVAIVSGEPASSQVCDIGCGNGYLAAELGKRGFRVTGVDASASGIEVARRHYETGNVRFVCANLDSGAIDKPARDGMFDIVVSSDVVEHLYRPSALVRAAARLLRPGGLLVLGTPYHGYLKNLAISLLGQWDRHHTVSWDGGHIKFFSVRMLRQLVEGNGFSVTGFHFHGRTRWLWKNMICLARSPALPTR